MPPNEFAEENILNKIHRWMYPPKSKYYWYRRGKVKVQPLSVKYLQFAVLSFLVAFAGSGGMMFAIILILTIHMEEYNNFMNGAPSIVYPLLEDFGSSNKSNEIFANVSAAAARAMNHDISGSPGIQAAMRDPYFMLGWMILAGTSTFVVYFLGAQTIHNMYYVKRRNEAQLWKCQPNRWPTEELFLEEKLTGCFNAFVSGFAGTGLFFLHQNYPFLKLYYSVESRGWLHFIAGCMLVYFWVDFYSYWIHRILHHKWIYKYVHKWHHRYKAPTAFGAFAIHPIEYIGFQTAGIWCCAIFPVHVMSFLTVVTFVAYHNQVDHSGVYYEGDLPWVPSTKYHDDHHQYFHLNYGVTLVLWDWLFGTLRQSDRVYGEDIFVGDQDKELHQKKAA